MFYIVIISGWKVVPVYKNGLGRSGSNRSNRFCAGVSRKKSTEGLSGPDLEGLFPTRCFVHRLLRTFVIACMDTILFSRVARKMTCTCYFIYINISYGIDIDKLVHKEK